MGGTQRDGADVTRKASPLGGVKSLHNIQGSFVMVAK